jgi:drug/metabolite transporter (DMT)-like permease
LTETDPHSRLPALGVLLAGACVIAFSPILVRLTQTGPAAAAVWRLGFALPALAVMARGAGGRIAPPSRLALTAGAMFALDLGFWHYGIKYTSVGLATALSNMTPVAVTAFAWIFLKQRPQRLFLAAVAIAVGEAWLMAGARRGAAGLDPPLGNALSAATAFWYALYMLAIGQARRRESAIVLMFWSTAAALPLVLAAAWLLGERIIPAAAAGWAACAGLGLVHVAGQGAIAWAMGRLPTVLASVVVLIQPVVAALLGWLLFREAVTGLQALGAAVALGGVILAQWASRRPDPASPASAPSAA